MKAGQKVGRLELRERMGQILVQKAVLKVVLVGPVVPKVALMEILTTVLMLVLLHLVVQEVQLVYYLVVPFVESMRVVLRVVL